MFDRRHLRALSVLVALLLSFPALAQQAGAQGGNSAPEDAQRYLDRAATARDTGTPEQELAVLQEGLSALGAESKSAYWIYLQLRQYYSDRGNQALALSVAEKQLRTTSSQGQEISVLAALTSLRSSLQDPAGAKEASDRMYQALAQARSSRAWARLGDLWQAIAAWASGNTQAHVGHVAEAEASFNACLSSMQKFLGPNPDAAVRQAFYVADCSTGLMAAYVQQGKLADAGAIAVQQRRFIESVAESQQRPQLLARVAPHYARIALEQGHDNKAREILDTALSQLLNAGAGEASLRVANLRLQLAQIEMLEGHWEKALEYHMIRRRGLQSAHGERGNNGVASPEFGYTLVRLGRAKEAVDMLAQITSAREKLFDATSIYRWEARAFYGVALAAAGERDAARKELSVAVPKLLELAHGERSSTDAGVLRTARLNWILDGYINLLSDYARSDQQAAGLDAVSEAFRMADIARGSSVQQALAASASRASIGDPALAELARREQDLQHEESALADAIGNLLSRGRIAEQDKIVAAMQATLAKLRTEHAQVQRDLQRRFPEYANLLEPRPLGIADIQKLLKPGEALLSIYTGSDRSLVWAVPAQGKVAFAVVPLNAEQIGERVARLRRTLDPGNVSIDNLPQFDFETAYELYQQLLAPVGAGWQAAHELIVVPHGRLGQLPFSVLTTQPWKNPASKIRYAAYADAPWLIKRMAISQLPAAISLTALRSRAAADRPQRAFIGFGDPVFAAAGADAASTTRGGGRRNLVITATEEKKNDIAGKIDFALLPALPDTAEEIQEVAKTLHAETARDLFLQRRASEHNVKTGDLAAYRVVMFATHGLVPGEMPGLYQPALALSNPALSGDGEDGMLTMEEILGLKLHADWVVLSACNTASSSGSGSEAVSGLGRAFFYAGAKALLVTNWPVETVSARLLTTNAFRRQTENIGTSRARAMQESELDLMKQSSGNEFSYAHPMFWAPYVVVGDGS